jgi:hypothetical protein
MEYLVSIYIFLLLLLLIIYILSVINVTHGYSVCASEKNIAVYYNIFLILILLLVTYYPTNYNLLLVFGLCIGGIIVNMYLLSKIINSNMNNNANIFLCKCAYFCSAIFLIFFLIVIFKSISSIISTSNA